MSRDPTRQHWSLYEEHLDEAAFCHRAWSLARAAPHYSLLEIEAGPEERLFAHLDALDIGGRAVAERLLLPALHGVDSNAASAAALALLAADGEEPLDAVLAAVSCDHPNAAAIGGALARDRRRAHAARLAQAWVDADAWLRGFLIEPLAAMMPEGWSRVELPRCIAASDPALAERALRCVWRAPERELHAVVRRALESEVPAVRSAAIVAALALGLPESWHACRAAARAQPHADRTLLAVACAAGSGELLRAVYARFDAGDHCADLLWALGFAGTREAADRLASCLDEPASAPLAAEALAAITGLRIEAELAQPPPPRAAGDFLATPNAVTVRRAWAVLRTGLPDRVRHALGVPADSSGLRDAIERGAAWRHEVYAIALALRERTALPIDPSDWARAQRRQLRGSVASSQTRNSSHRPASRSSA